MDLDETIGKFAMPHGASPKRMLFAVCLADHGIGVFELRPGLTATEMTSPSRVRYDAFVVNGGRILRRWGEPQDVARVALTAAQGLLPYTAGQAIRGDRITSAAILSGVG